MIYTRENTVQQIYNDKGKLGCVGLVKQPTLLSVNKVVCQPLLILCQFTELLLRTVSVLFETTNLLPKTIKMFTQCLFKTPLLKLETT